MVLIRAAALAFVCAAAGARGKLVAAAAGDGWTWNGGSRSSSSAFVIILKKAGDEVYALFNKRPANLMNKNTIFLPGGGMERKDLRDTANRPIDRKKYGNQLPSWE